MKDDVKVSMSIIFVITLILLSIVPLTVQSVSFKNGYGKLEVYPDVSRNIIRQKQFFNVTSYLPSQDLDIAFRFNESLSYGGVYYYNNGNYTKLDVDHQVYNDKHWYLLNDIYFETDETKQGYWEYDTPINSSGKWDMFIKRSSDSLQYAIDNDLYVHLDPWWSSDFKYMSGSCVTNNISDYSMMINISNVTGGDLVIGTNHQLNWSDIRFVSEDNSTELYHWIEYYADNYAYFWINISDEDYINCYYGANISIGNSSYNNPYNTFYFFEPFNDLGNWTVVGSNLAVSGGWLTITNDGSYDYAYIDFDDTSNNYFIKTRSQAINPATANCLHALALHTSVHTGFSYDSNSQIIAVYGPVSSCQLQTRQVDSVSGTCNYYISAGYPSYPLYRSVCSYDYGNYIYYDDMAVALSQTSLCGMNVQPDVLQIYTRDRAGTYITKWDYVFVGLYNSTSPQPSFCSWSIEIPYCETLFTVSNESPVSDSVVASLNISYITVQVNFTLGSGDSINISLVADNGLFYRNITTDVVNNSYSLNVIFANFSAESNYTYYVNFTGGGCFASFSYDFITTQYNLYEILQIIDYKIDVIDNKIIGVDDELDINIGLDGTLLTLVLFAVFFVVGYTINKRSGGILMIFSGFTLIAFEFLVSSVLNAILVIPLLSPIAILIIILGVRKWLYPVENEKTKSEGT